MSQYTGGHVNLPVNPFGGRSLVVPTYGFQAGGGDAWEPGVSVTLYLPARRLGDLIEALRPFDPAAEQSGER